jgi:hypothetical protein
VPLLRLARLQQQPEGGRALCQALLALDAPADGGDAQARQLLKQWVPEYQTAKVATMQALTCSD